MPEVNKTQEETRKVKFLDDYNPSGLRGKAIYKEDEVHFMHMSVLDKIKKRGAKVEVIPVDWKAETEEARIAFEEAEAAEANNK